MEKLEEHIRRIRRDLDLYNPSSEIWNRIENRLKKRRRVLTLQWISIAAMFIVIFGATLILLKQGSKESDRNNELTENPYLKTLSPSLKETEIYYNNMVNSLYHKATPLLTSNPEVEKELSDDLTRIDSICIEIKKDLKDNVANEEVVEALIQNYRIKIRILEDILENMKEVEGNPGKTNRYDL